MNNALPATTENDSPDREDLFIRNLFICKSTQDAALEAGYSPTYSSGPIYQKIKSAKFQEKLRKYAIAHELLNIPKIMALENAALKHLDGKPEELPKFAAILKQKKQVAGLLQHDAAPQAPTISIKDVGQLMLNVYQDTHPVLGVSLGVSDSVVDAEIVK